VTAGRSFFGAGSQLIAAIVVDFGCGGGRVCEGPAAHVQWTISDSQGAPETCSEAGAATVVVDLGDREESFPCIAGSGQTGMVAVRGAVILSARLVSLGGQTVAEIPAMPVGLDGCGVTFLPPLDFVVPRSCDGTPALHVTWDIVKAVTNAPPSCLQASAPEVNITIGDLVDAVPCTDYGTVTPLLPPGTYPLRLDLLDLGGNVISTFTAPQSIDIFTCQITDIGNVTFPVN
jgi:hypothetical protein